MYFIVACLVSKSLMMTSCSMMTQVFVINNHAAVLTTKGDIDQRGHKMKNLGPEQPARGYEIEREGRKATLERLKSYSQQKQHLHSFLSILKTIRSRSKNVQDFKSEEAWGQSEQNDHVNSKTRFSNSRSSFLDTIKMFKMMLYDISCRYIGKASVFRTAVIDRFTYMFDWSKFQSFDIPHFYTKKSLSSNLEFLFNVIFYLILSYFGFPVCLTVEKSPKHHQKHLPNYINVQFCGNINVKEPEKLKIMGCEKRNKNREQIECQNTGEQSGINTDNDKDQKHIVMCVPKNSVVPEEETEISKMYLEQNLREYEIFVSMQNISNNVCELKMELNNEDIITSITRMCECNRFWICQAPTRPIYSTEFICASTNITSSEVQIVFLNFIHDYLRKMNPQNSLKLQEYADLLRLLSSNFPYLEFVKRYSINSDSNHCLTDRQNMCLLLSDVPEKSQVSNIKNVRCHDISSNDNDNDCLKMDLTHLLSVITLFGNNSTIGCEVSSLRRHKSRIEKTISFEEKAVVKNSKYPNFVINISKDNSKFPWYNRFSSKKSKNENILETIVEDVTENSTTSQIKLENCVKNDQKRDYAVQHSKEDQDNDTFPKILEVRGSEQEREQLIQKLSERFFSKRSNGEPVICDLQKGTDIKPKAETVDDNGEETPSEKDSAPWYFQWQFQSFQNVDKQLHVYPISQYFQRFATFSNWPIESPISAFRLAEAGFHYKGIGQIVECASCQLQVSNWKQGDIPLEIHTKLSSNCRFLLEKGIVSETPDHTVTEEKKYCPQLPEKHSVDISEDGMNAAIGLQSDLPEHFNSALTLSEQPNESVSQSYQDRFGYSEAGIPETEVDSTSSVKNPDYETIPARLESFRAWSYHDKQSPRVLVDAGFFYLGKDDIVRCYCCDIGLAEWDSDDDPWVEHARHSPNCAYIRRERGDKFVDDIQQAWSQIYSPKHPQLADYHVRFQTFAEWPEHMDQRPSNLCEAGFFFTGEEDVVRCHYCDGGLRQWEPGDDPWMEHARWFPFCKYIVKIKGLAFIDDVARRYNEIYNNQVTEELNDLEESSIEETSRLLNEPQFADPVRSVVAQGFSLNNVMMAVQQFNQFNAARRNFTAEDLINIIIERERIGDVIPENATSPIVGGHSVNNKPSKALAGVVSSNKTDMEQLDDKQLTDVNMQLKSQLMCNMCNERENEIVFTPCGHRIVCESCSKDLRKCPKCNQNISKRIKTFLA